VVWLTVTIGGMSADDEITAEDVEWIAEAHLPDKVIEFMLGEHGLDGIAGLDGEAFALLYRDGERFGVAHEDLAEYAGGAWVGPGDAYLDRDEWRALFRAVGYREDDQPAARPTEPLVLYRGATPEDRAAWSWTENPDAAAQYASGWWVQADLGLVWRATVAPEHLLARIIYQRYSEYIVDTDGLTIEPHTLWCRCPVPLDPFRGPVPQARVALDIHELVTCTRDLQSAS